MVLNMYSSILAKIALTSQSLAAKYKLVQIHRVIPTVRSSVTRRCRRFNIECVSAVRQYPATHNPGRDGPDHISKPYQKTQVKLWQMKVTWLHSVDR